jgi:adenylate cyclase
MNEIGFLRREPHLAPHQEARLRVVFRKEEHNNLRLVAWIRTFAMTLVAIWLVLAVRTPFIVENVISCGLFVVLGWAYYALGANLHDRPWYTVLFPLIEALILIDNLLPIAPWHKPALPYPVYLRFGSVAFLFLPLALAAFLYSPWRTFWSAALTALAWTGAVAYILMQPGAFSATNLAGMGEEEPRRFLATLLNPNFVDLAGLQADIFVLLLVGVLLSLVVWRTRALVRRQMLSERNRAHLARYFSPNIVDELQAADAPFGEVRIQPVAVLFADIIGFTRMSEKLPPERTIELLRSFHRRMARVVFAHRGTLDKYIGDAVMVTFGTPRTGPRDAVDALHCTRAMLDELDRWNEKRIARGADPVHVGIGVHYGSAVLGDIGDERRLEFAVIGDTVNVASRIERLTRALGVDILVSQDLVDAARAQAPEQAASALAGFEEGQPRVLRGRRGAVVLWSFRRATAAAAPAARSA